MTVPRKSVKGSPEPRAEDPAGATPQDIEALKKRYDRLSHEKTAAETDLKIKLEQIDDLKAKAREAYGTDDLEALRAKLEAMRRENEEKRARYQESLARIEAELKEIEDRYREAAGGR